MPFVYDLRLADRVTEYTFVQQLVPAGSMVTTGQPVATVTDGAMDWHVAAPRAGLLVEWFSHAGTEVEGGDALARVVSEGQEAPVEPVEPARLG